VTAARLHLTFPEHAMQEPIVWRLGHEFGLVTNIRRANVEDLHGWVILEVDGADEDLARAMSWLGEQGVQVDRIADEES
jgi:L-aspartate semialdehyde sulfurtransferase ferredoxin